MIVRRSMASIIVYIFLIIVLPAIFFAVLLYFSPGFVDSIKLEYSLEQQYGPLILMIILWGLFLIVPFVFLLINIKWIVCKHVIYVRVKKKRVDGGYSPKLRRKAYSYYITFEFPDGSMREYDVSNAGHSSSKYSRHVYDNIRKGQKGKLTYIGRKKRGGFFLSFQKDDTK